MEDTTNPVTPVTPGAEEEVVATPTPETPSTEGTPVETPAAE